VRDRRRPPSPVLRHIRLLVILAAIGVAVAVPFAVFSLRSPVLVVTDAPFIALYGKTSLQRQQFSASVALFRRVKPVMIADGVSSDMVVFALREAASQPLCVLFARSQALAALSYHEQFPEIPVVVLRGLVSVPELPSPDGLLCVYETDREVDLYRAGLCAGILGRAKRNLAQKTEKPAKNEPEPAATPRTEAPASQANPPQTYVLWQDRFVQGAGRELFSRGVQEEDPESNAIFINLAVQMPDVKRVACLTLTGAGFEYLEGNPPIPLILFTWLNPALTSREVIVQFDDSPWALAVPAVRMAVLQQAEGKIPSKPLIFSRKTANNRIYQALKKSAKKMP